MAGTPTYLPVHSLPSELAPTEEDSLVFQSGAEDGDVKLLGIDTFMSTFVNGSIEDLQNRFGGYLPTNSNIDNLTAEFNGFWLYDRTSEYSHTGTYPNDGNTGWIEHKQSTSSGYATQMLRADSNTSERIYIRYKVNGTWGSWNAYLPANRITVKTIFQDYEYNGTTANGWEYINKSIVVPSGHLYLTRIDASYASGRPIGIGVHTAVNTSGTIIPSRGSIESSNGVTTTPVFYLTAGTYYVYVKRASIPTLANKHSAYALDIIL